MDSFVSFQTCKVASAVSKVNSIVKKLLAASQADSKFLRCSYCSKLRSKTNIKRHLLTHMDIPYKCGHCSLFFHQKKLLDEHMEERHNSKVYVCNSCGTKYRSANALKEHIQIKHTSCGLAYNCELCGKQFNRQGHYEDHMNVHKKVNPWACKLCNRTYKNRSALNRHMSECGKNVTNTCEHCGQIYKTRHSLHEHSRREHANVSYLCKCGNTFKSRTTRMRHRRVCEVYQKELVDANTAATDDSSESRGQESLDPATGIFHKESSSSTDIPLSAVVSGDVTIYFESSSSTSNVCELDGSSLTELVVVEDNTETASKQIVTGDILDVSMVSESEVHDQEHTSFRQREEASNEDV